MEVQDKAAVWREKYLDLEAKMNAGDISKHPDYLAAQAALAALAQENAGVRKRLKLQKKMTRLLENIVDGNSI